MFTEAKNTIRKSDKNTRNHHKQESQEVSPFSAGGHKYESNRQDSMTAKYENKLQTNHKKHHLGTASKKATGGLKHV